MLDALQQAKRNYFFFLLCRVQYWLMILMDICLSNNIFFNFIRAHVVFNCL